MSRKTSRIDLYQAWLQVNSQQTSVDEFRFVVSELRGEVTPSISATSVEIVEYSPSSRLDHRPNQHPDHPSDNHPERHPNSRPAHAELVCGRLMDLGIVAGETLVVKTRAAWGEPIFVEIHGSQFALRRREAECIFGAHSNLHPTHEAGASSGSGS